MELCDTLLDVTHNLVGCSKTCVGVCLCSLGTHLLRSGEVTTFELSELSICIWLDVGDVLEVGTLSKEFEEFWLIDNFLTSGVDEDTTLLHAAHECLVDALLGLCCSRDVERHDVASLKEFVL